LYLDVPKWKKLTSIIKSDDLYIKDNGYGIETEPHVTILYGFNNDVKANEAFELFKKNTSLKPISIKISGISTFENDEFDVVKFDVHSEELTRLNKLMKTLPYTSEFDEYHPHITIAYVKKGEGKKYVKTFDNELTLTGNKLVFSYSEFGDDNVDMTLNNNLNEKK